MPRLRSSPADEYRAARHDAAFIDLPWRGLFSVRGRDAVAFLHGMLSQDVRSMAEGEVRPSCLLDRRGHLMADLRIRRLADGAILLVSRDRLDAIHAHLARHRIMEALDLVPMIGMRVVLVCGPRSAEITADRGVDRWAADDVPGPCFHLHGEDLPGLTAGLRAAGALPIGASTLDRLRIEEGRPWFGRDMDESFLPQEVGLDDAVSTTKGCYLGQEVMARLRHRGQVKRLLCGVRIPGTPPLPAGEIRARGEPIGRLSSVARPPGEGDTLGLAVLGAALRGAREGITVDGRAASIEDLPFREARHG